MAKFPSQLFAEPNPDPNTLANLGPLAAMAGSWESTTGKDVKPTADGAEKERYVERMDLVPIDPQTNGPQLFYGMRYHTHIVKPGEVETLHDQVGYWLWEPATGMVLLSLTIPRGQIVLAKGMAAANAKSFTVEAVRGSTENGICSNSFLEANFRTDRFAMTVTVHDNDSWSYEETTTLQIKSVPQPFSHTDGTTLRRIGPPEKNPLWAAHTAGTAPAAT